MTWLRKHKDILGSLALILVMLVGLAYIAFGALRWQPLTSTYKLTIDFEKSAGLQETSQVTLRGARVGEVDTIRVQPNGVQVVVEIEDDVQLNRDSQVAALSLSAAGEQYVDFSPPTSDGPYFRDGDTVAVAQTRGNAPFSGTLESALNVISQIEPGKLRSTVEELKTGLVANEDGSSDLRKLLFAGGSIFSDLAPMLDQTQALIGELGTIFETTANIQPDFGTLVSSAHTVVNAAVASDEEIRTVLGKGPSQLTSVTGSLNQMRDPITDVMTQLLDVTRQGALRAPALANLLPSIRDGAAQSIKMFHDGAWWAFASIYPRPHCNYSVTPTRPTQLLELTVPVNLYCVTEDPKQQIRGSVNAPRPEGDDTAGPPPGYDPNARTVPLGN